MQFILIRMERKWHGSMNIVVVGGDDYKYHDFSIIGEAFYSFLNNAGFHVTITEDCNVFLAKNIKVFDVIVCYMNRKILRKSQEQGLLDSITGPPWGKTGKPKGFIGIHTAACSFPGSGAYHRMLGSKFLVHPEMGEELYIEVKNPAHPVMKDISDFTIIDEFYMLELYPPFELLLFCRYRGFEHPIAWVKPYGLGRVFYTTLGHGIDQINNNYFKKMIMNAIEWSIIRRDFFKK
ncbi:MAG: ThuA domain-containing protein [Spirochaetales bacterium]|nr:ThuA domain-containing protein [Spirochaetales bacterium]